MADVPENQLDQNENALIEESELEGIAGASWVHAGFRTDGTKIQPCL